MFHGAKPQDLVASAPVSIYSKLLPLGQSGGGWFHQHCKTAVHRRLADAGSCSAAPVQESFGPGIRCDWTKNSPPVSKSADRECAKPFLEMKVLQNDDRMMQGDATKVAIGHRASAPPASAGAVPQSCCPRFYYLSPHAGVDVHASGRSRVEWLAFLRYLACRNCASHTTCPLLHLVAPRS